MRVSLLYMTSHTGVVTFPDCLTVCLVAKTDITKSHAGSQWQSRVSIRHMSDELGHLLSVLSLSMLNTLLHRMAQSGKCSSPPLFQLQGTAEKPDVFQNEIK